MEEHFYIVYPLLLSLLLRLAGLRKAAFVLVGVCAAVLAWRYQLARDQRIDSGNERITPPMRASIPSSLAASWLCGRTRPIALPAVRRVRVRLSGACLVAGFGLLLFSLLYRSSSFRETARYSVQGLALVPIFYCVIKYHHLKVFSFLNSKVFRTMGVYSYAILPDPPCHDYFLR